MRPQDEAAIVACIPGLRRYARGLTSDKDRADDLVQDTLERAWSHFAMWRQRGDVRAWMFAIMHNQFVDRLRAQGSRPEVATGDSLPETPERGQQTDGLEVRDLDRCLQRLPSDQREVLLMIAVEAFSYQDAARALGVPVGTIMSRLSRARERLRIELQAGDSAAPGPAALLPTAIPGRITRVK